VFASETDNNKYPTTYVTVAAKINQVYYLRIFLQTYKHCNYVQQIIKTEIICKHLKKCQAIQPGWRNLGS
jgi:hypothetical protein